MPTCLAKYKNNSTEISNPDNYQDKGSRSLQFSINLIVGARQLATILSSKPYPSLKKMQG